MSRSQAQPLVTINNNSVRISATDEVRHEKAAEEAYTLEAKLFANEVSIEGAEET